MFMDGHVPDPAENFVQSLALSCLAFSMSMANLREIALFSNLWAEVSSNGNHWMTSIECPYFSQSLSEMGTLYTALSGVLASRQDPQEMSGMLSQLLGELKTAEVGILQAAFNSAMLPLCLIMQCSARLKKDSTCKVNVPAAKSDRVVELALGLSTLHREDQKCRSQIPE